MTTIFTDSFCFEELDIQIGDFEIGHKGRDLILTTDNEREFRVRLSDEQFRDLAEALLLNGFIQNNEPPNS